MIRFSTVAANADVLGDDTPLATDEATVARDAVVRRSADRPEHRRGRQSGEPRPGPKPGSRPGKEPPGGGQS